MNIKIIAVGKIKDKWLLEGLKDYSKRLRKFSQVQILEVEDAPDSWPTSKILLYEAEQILKKIKPEEQVFTLDLAGVCVTSPQFSRILVQGLEVGGAGLTFIIGGSWGIDASVLARSNKRISFSELTFTHQMVRLLLLEQIYRGFKIYAGEKYHK